MTFNWASAYQGIVTGVVGALVFWVIALIREGLRNWWLRRSLRNQLRHTSCGHSLQGVTTSVHNHLQKAFRVRDVSLVTPKGNFAFNATGEVSNSDADSGARVTKEIIRRVEKGDMVQISTQIAQRRWVVKLEHAGFVEVKPFTSQGFILPAELVREIDTEPQHLQITIEYETWTKRTRLLTQDTEGWAVDHMKKVVQHFRSELANGNLDAARVLFRLPPVLGPLASGPAGSNEAEPEGRPDAGVP